MSLSPDLPRTDPADDALGYAPFAFALASAIREMTPPDGLVLSIHGPWGSGKSTTLKFIEHYLTEPSRQGEEVSTPIILHFNPWWFSGREDLTRLLLGQLRARLGDKDFGDVKARLADFADLLSKVPVIPGSQAGEFVADKLRELPDMVALKNKVDTLLREKQQTVLVIVDDIDRLHVSEIRDLFRAIKAVGSFPRVVYLLAFDKYVVAKALEEQRGGSGQEYLEKIVQVPFELPLPDKSALRRLLLEKLDKVLAETPQSEIDETYWANVYFDGVDPFVETPRDVERLTNVLRVTYPTVRQEVNPVDFIALEALRVFCPPAYEMVRARPDLFTGFRSNSLRDTDQIQEAELREHESWMSELPSKDRDRVRSLLRRIFPRFASALGGGDHGSDFATNWRRERLARSEEVFPVYFRLAVPENGVSQIEIQTILTQTADETALEKRLLQLADQRLPDGRSRIRLVLQRVSDYIEHIPVTNIERVVMVLMRSGDRLIQDEDERKGFLDFIDTDRMVWFLARDLLRRRPKEERARILRAAIQQNVAPSTVAAFVARIVNEHHDDGSQPMSIEERLLPGDDLDALKMDALESIREASRSGELSHAPYLRRTLNIWKEWGKWKRCERGRKMPLSLTMVYFCS
jgi:predicted KAP-like P-loop ATPase